MIKKIINKWQQKKCTILNLMSITTIYHVNAVEISATFTHFYSFYITFFKIVNYKKKLCIFNIYFETVQNHNIIF